MSPSLHHGQPSLAGTAKAWRCVELLAAEAYAGEGERSAFRTGYSDGFFGDVLWSASTPEFFPHAYKAGYSAGRADGQVHDG